MPNAKDEETKRVVKEYEDFVYIVSHDLSTPLRHVKEFTNLLIENRRGNLSNEEREYVRFIEKSLKKLDEMQKALLDFSRINTQAGKFRKTNCNDIVTKALSQLDEVIKTHKPIIECDNLPTITVDPKQFLILFINLIDNALKFHDKDSSKRKISITARKQENGWIFEIKDNGIGIAEKHCEDVLKLFRCLNPDKFKGMGAGLTISNKIIQRHGGTIFIKSEENKGTSVFFSAVKQKEG